MKTLQKHIDEVMEDFTEYFVEMHSIHGRDMHNRPPLYDTEIEQVQEIKDFLTEAIIKTAQLTHDSERPEEAKGDSLFNIGSEFTTPRDYRRDGRNSCLSELDSKFKAFMAEGE